jgi:kumamolisin
MRTWESGFVTSFMVLGLLSGAMAQTTHTAVPYPTQKTPEAIDRGALTAESSATPLSITIALRLRDANEAENLLTALHTPGDPQFHQFLTAQQFAARFAPADTDVAKVTAALSKYGLTVQRATATTLTATGLPSNMERAFSVSLHSYEVGAHENVPGYTFHAPLTRATIPAEISGFVTAVAGLDNRPSLHPMNRTLSPKVKIAKSTAPPTTPDAPGLWTVTDFADYYDVQPLYKRGVTGSGRTIGIVTFASFTPSDAFTYWSAVGLSVNPNRIKIVNVDGGPGPISDVGGSDETTIDVEQSGGIAPGAKIIVYQAPGTAQGSFDNFAAAIDSNSAETISVSWGDWEECANRGIGDFPTACLPPDRAYVEATHELFVRAAIQGQTLFAAAGDDGAYDNNGDCPANAVCNNTLSVDYPGNDPAITAAGGTTLPGLQELCINATCTAPFYDVNIPHERVWGWDYLIGYCNALGFDPVDCGIFPAGGGGGVSSMFVEPLYQFLLPGTQLSQPDQSWIVNGDVVYKLPGYFPGRNVPDISFNADPETGYVLYYTSSVYGYGISEYYGGTSFVAPQLNGVSALLGEYLGGRMGLLNFPLYLLDRTGQAYAGAKAPLHAISDGDNWFYYGRKGYNPGAGLGTLDVANFADALRGWF